MSKQGEMTFIHFEAKPKRGNAQIVAEKIYEMMSYFAEIFDKNRRNCNFHPERRGDMWTVLITFETEEAKGLLEQDSRFQEAMTDIQAYCKPAHRIRRTLHYLFRPSKPFVTKLRSPVIIPNQDK